MNHFAATTMRIGAGWLAMCRYVHKGDFWPIMDGEHPKVFPTRDKALIAAQSAVIANMNGTMRSQGERATALRRTAEAIFKSGRKIAVEVKGKRHGKTPNDS